MTQAVDFALCSAFTRSPYGGNPAATFFLQSPLPDTEAYQRVAQTFNQPIATFILPDSSDDANDNTNTLRFSVRWFTPKVEAPICGHGTVAASYYMFKSGRVPSSVSTLVFHNKTGELHARKVASEPEPQIEIELAAFELQNVSVEEFEIARQATATALRKDEVKVKEVLKNKNGSGGTEVYLLIVLDDEENLSGVDVEPLAFVCGLTLRSFRVAQHP